MTQTLETCLALAPAHWALGRLSLAWTSRRWAQLQLLHPGAALHLGSWVHTGRPIPADSIEWLQGHFAIGRPLRKAFTFLLSKEGVPCVFSKRLLRSCCAQGTVSGCG